MSAGPGLYAIWAEDRNGVIGSGTGMLWHVPDDLECFKEITLGAPVIMGRHSWEALGKPLPDRFNIVITRQPSYDATGAAVVGSLEEAIELARAQSPEHIWIIGGAQVYEEALDRLDELVISYLDLSVESEGPKVHAPFLDPSVWRIDENRSDTHWRPRSGDARWRQVTYVRQLTR